MFFLKRADVFLNVWYRGELYKRVSIFKRSYKLRFGFFFEKIWFLIKFKI